MPDSLVGRQGKCPSCGALFDCVEMHDVPSAPGTAASSGTPAEISRWNWGAFFWTWLWSISNRVWIGLLSLLPGLNFIMAIVLGVKGSQWAWENRQWDGVEHFKRVQKKWAVAGLIVFLLTLLVIIVSVITGVSGELAG